MNNIKYWIWFSNLKELNCIQKNNILEYISLERLWNLNINDLKKLNQKIDNKLDEKELYCIKDINYRVNLDKYEEYYKKNNISLITIKDAKYPEKLKNIYDKPIVLFCKGNLELLNKNSIAIIGSRKCSKYGMDMSKKIAYMISKSDKCVVSGLARGIDSFAHIGSLQAKGDTIAVLGHGFDMVYPLENKQLYEEIINRNGLIVCEYNIGTKIDRKNFPARNRIISALSDAIIVVEAKKRSGTLSTVDFALEYGKEIFAVPGNIDSINSEGTNNLIKQGANIFTDINDII